jgi:Raf kinase inhibitor-like YbhB/YbcL family protein
MAFSIQCDAFADGAPIPAKFTCDGKDFSPHLRIKGIPARTKSIALIMDDPDAPMGTFVHWVLYDLPGGTSELEENIPHDEILTSGAKQGITDFRRVGYGGPCPPRGKPHRYFFKVYSLDTLLNLPPKATKEQVEEAMEGHILARSQIMGTYERK